MKAFLALLCCLLCSPAWAATTIFTQSLPSNDSGDAGFSFRETIGSPALTGAGQGQLRVTFNAASAANLILLAASVCKAATPATNANCTGAPVALKFGGNAGVTITAGTTAVSDWVTDGLSLGASDNLLVCWDIGATGNPALVSTKPSGTHVYFQPSTATCSTQSPSGFTSDAAPWWGISLVETQAAPSSGRPSSSVIAMRGAGGAASGGGGGGGGSYPASVVAAGLQSVYDLASSGTGYRGSLTSTLGVTTLPCPGNATYSGGYLIITGNCTFANWEFQVPGNLGVIARGNATTVTFTDCHFGPQAGNPAVNDTQFYGLEASDDGSTPTVVISHSTFDGHKYQSNAGPPAISGPWSGSAIYTNNGTVSCDHCKFTGIPYDVIKETNGSYTQTFSLVQAYGWNQNSDADGVQQISGTIDIEHSMYDISDGGAAALGTAFPGDAANSGLFVTIDTPSTGNAGVTVKNNIWKGYSGYTLGNCPSCGTYPSTTPINTLSVCDNHTLVASFNASISGTTLTVNSVSSGTINPTSSPNNTLLVGVGVAGGTHIISGSNPTYTLDVNNGTIASENMSTNSVFHVVGGDWENNVVQTGNSGITTNGGAESSSTCITTWTTNLNYDSAATISKPSF